MGKRLGKFRVDLNLSILKQVNMIEKFKNIKIRQKPELCEFHFDFQLY